MLILIMTNGCPDDPTLILEFRTIESNSLDAKRKQCFRIQNILKFPRNKEHQILFKFSNNFENYNATKKTNANYKLV